MITGKQVLFDGTIALVDPLIVALPISILTMFLVWLYGRRTSSGASANAA